MRPVIEASNGQSLTFKFIEAFLIEIYTTTIYKDITVDPDKIPVLTGGIGELSNYGQDLEKIKRP
ncbi:unnamed protein product [marine sediment metagenome]|uniref:Uncharacterized protein n=1 Tax=marine sediment metagenome TaxID=412755 RepID=X1LUC0_9ZZZZ